MDIANHFKVLEPSEGRQMLYLFSICTSQGRASVWVSYQAPVMELTHRQLETS
jgi:hypothetical protein